MTSPARSTPAQQRAASRAAILDAAVSTYGEAGPNGASLRDVANSAGVTQPLISLYFESKAGLVEAVGQRMTAHVAATIDSVDRCGAQELSRLLRAARDHRSMTRLLIRSGLGDMSPHGFPACLGGPWSSPVDDADERDRRAQVCRYAAVSLLLGWLTFDGFMTPAVRLGNMSERRRDDAIAAAAAHLWSLGAAEGPTLVAPRAVTREPAARADVGPATRSTRDALLASAIELFAEHGPASVSIRDVARHAGMNHGLLHRHFGSKEALIAEAIDVGVASLMPGVRAPGGFDIDRVVHVMHHDPIPARLIARTLVDDIAIRSVRVRYPVMEGLLALARDQPADSRPPGLDDPRIAAAVTASMVAGSVIWGPAIRTVGSFDNDVQAALTDVSRLLLGVARR